jgi:hypothetical protein
MRINGRHVLLALGLSLLVTPEPPRAAEICGDGVDNDSNTKTDEGCQAPRVTGIHESPLPSSATGMVSPKSGQVVYPEPPDLAPTVAFGPPLEFRRMIRAPVL